MKKQVLMVSILWAVGVARVCACPDLTAEEAASLIHNAEYTDPQGVQWELESTFTTQEGSKISMEFEPILEKLQKPGTVVRLLKSMFAKKPPSPVPTPLLNAKLMNHSCEYMVVHSGQAPNTMVTQEIYNFRIHRKAH